MLRTEEIAVSAGDDLTPHLHPPSGLQSAVTRTAQPTKLFGRYQELALLALGFVLTTVVGSFLADRYQAVAAEKERQSRREEADAQKATQLYEETSRSSSQLIARAVACDGSLRNAEDYLQQARVPSRRAVVTGPDLHDNMTHSCKMMSDAWLAWNDVEQRVRPMVKLYFSEEVLRSFDALDKSVIDSYQHSLSDEAQYMSRDFLGPARIDPAERARLRQAAVAALARFSDSAVGRLRTYRPAPSPPIP